MAVCVYYYRSIGASNSATLTRPGPKNWTLYLFAATCFEKTGASPLSKLSAHIAASQGSSPLLTCVSHALLLGYFHGKAQKLKEKVNEQAGVAPALNEAGAISRLDLDECRGAPVGDLQHVTSGAAAIVQKAINSCRSRIGPSLPTACI